MGKATKPKKKKKKPLNKEQISQQMSSQIIGCKSSQIMPSGDKDIQAYG